MTSDSSNPENSICWEPCATAKAAATNVGYSDKACADGSEFRNAWNSCAACLRDPSQTPSDILSDDFMKLLSTCHMDIQYTTTVVTVSDGTTSTKQVVQSIATAPATTTSGTKTSETQTGASSTTGADEKTQTVVVTSAGGISTMATAASSTSTSESSSGDPVNAGLIAGPVIGGAVGLTIIVFLISIIWRRRRHKLRQTTIEMPENMDRRQDTDRFDKPQLHGDCIPRRASDASAIYEMPAHMPASFLDMTEKPANEMPAQELPAEDVFPRPSRYDKETLSTPTTPLGERAHVGMLMKRESSWGGNHNGSTIGLNTNVSTLTLGQTFTNTSLPVSDISKTGDGENDKETR